MHRPHWKGLTCVAAAAAAALLLSACGSSSPSTGGTSAGSSGAKSTINIGYGALVIPGVFDSNKLWWPGVQAGIAYIKANGGWGGHAAKVDLCIQQGDPASEQKCDDQFAAEHVAAYTGIMPNNATVGIPILSKDGVQSFNFPETPAELKSPWESSYVPTLIAELTGVAKYWCAHGLKSVSVMLGEAASSVADEDAFAAGIYKSCGISVNYVPVPPGTADPEPYIQKALSTHPQGVYLELGIPPTTTLNDFHTAGYPSTQLVFGTQLMSTAFLSDPNSTGAIINEEYELDIPGAISDQTMYSQYVKDLAQVSPGASPFDSSVGFIQIVTIWEGLKAVNFDVASLHEYMTTKAPGSLTIPFSRVAQNTPGFSGLIQPYVQLVKLDNGQGTSLGWWSGFSMCTSSASCAQGMVTS
jgi:hypothetical protein